MRNYIKKNSYNHPIRERLLKGMSINQVSGCWEWSGAKDEKGYSLIWHKGQSRRAHRLSYQEFVGQIPRGLLVCHKCDNTGCINPDHLFLGTNKENIIDASRKGRTARGEKIYTAKLTAEDVVEIRKLLATGKYTQTEVGKRFGVGSDQISRIVNRIRWSHIP